MTPAIDPALGAALGRVRAAFAAGEPDGIRELLARDSFAIHGDGSIVSGEDLVPWYASFITPPTVLTLRPQWVRQVGNYAVLSSAWTTSGTTPDGSSVADSGRSADLLHREGGTWRILADSPFNASVGDGAKPLANPAIDSALAAELAAARNVWHSGTFGIDRDGGILQGSDLRNRQVWFAAPEQDAVRTTRWIRQYRNIAIEAVDWSISSGEAGMAADVFLREDGIWKLLVDNTFNAAVPADA